MERGTYKYRTLRGNDLVFQVGGSMTYCRVFNQEGELVHYYGSVTPPKVSEQDGQTIVLFEDFEEGSRRLHGVAIRPVITLG
jgi:argonaute-like protein implicated in RNA metabolism and viral defense